MATFTLSFSDDSLAEPVTLVQELTDHADVADMLSYFEGLGVLAALRQLGLKQGDPLPQGVTLAQPDPRMAWYLGLQIGWVAIYQAFTRAKLEAARAHADNAMKSLAVTTVTSGLPA